MKSKYPVEAFALTIILFSRNMKEAFAAGILVIVVFVFAILFHNIFKTILPQWSLRLCVLVIASSLCASLFHMAFYYLEVENTSVLWLLEFIIGLLVGKHILTNDLHKDYNLMLWESAIAWSFLILFGIIREYFSVGSIFENSLGSYPFFSNGLQNITFGFLASGIGIALVNQILKKTPIETDSLFVLLPIICFYGPVHTDVRVISVVLGILLSVVGLISVRKRIAFSNLSMEYKKLPIELISMGFIYMILSVF